MLDAEATVPFELNATLTAPGDGDGVGDGEGDGEGDGDGAGEGEGEGEGDGDGDVVDVAVPVTALDSVSPSAVTVTLPVNVADEVGENRTTTFCVEPAATVYEPPLTTVKEAGADTVTDRVIVLVLVTVNVRSTDVPMVVEPKSIEVGVTVKLACAVPLASTHGLSSCVESTALTATKYVVPRLRPVSLYVIVLPGAGAATGDETVTTEPA